MPELTLGLRLQQIRKEQKKSMRAVARQAEISVAYLSKIEHDEANPTVDVIKKLASALGMHFDELTAGVSMNDKVSAELPASLKEFIEKYEDAFEELKDPDWQKMLSGIRLRGRYPESNDDWLAIFTDTRRALRQED